MTPAIEQLKAAGVAYSTHEYARDEAPASKAELGYGLEAAIKLGLDPDQVFKTLLVGYDDRSGRVAHAVAIVPVSGRLALKALGTTLGTKRIEMCDPALAERITGYVVGGISPFGQRKRLPTVLDETAVLFDAIYVSGGRRGLDLGVAPNDLVRVLGATVADIAG